LFVAFLFKKMKIAIISDTHDNLTNLERFFKKIENLNIEILLHLGDVCFLPTLEFLVNHFKKKIYLVLGNGDNKKLSSFKKENLFIFEKIGVLEIEGKKIALTHFPTIANDLAKEEKYDFIFYGHLHFPREKKKGKSLLINPGNLAGVFFPASFAVLDLEKNKVFLEIL